MVILIYGSTLLAQKCAEYLMHKHTLIGYVPSINPTIPGKMPLREVNQIENYGIAISIQYDRKITNLRNAFNLHTGLLPEYGGCDVLYHSLKNGAQFQGLTFHKITEELDKGPIISKISYPVLPDDSIPNLYRRMLKITPLFLESCINLLDEVNVNICPQFEPIMHKRGVIDETDREFYDHNKKLLNEMVHHNL